MSLAAVIALLFAIVHCEPQSYYQQSNPQYSRSTYAAPAFSTPSTNYLPPDDYHVPHHQSYDMTDDHHSHDSEVPKSYEFGYSVKDAQSGNDYGRHESSDGNVVRGEYRVQLPDGRTQIVTYYADWKTGFHADVRYEGAAQYPQQSQSLGGGYDYQAPSDYSGSLTGFHSNTGYRNDRTAAYGTPGYK